MTTTQDIVTTDGTRIAVEDLGTGAPVVLTHGWNVGGEGWERVAARLVAGGLRTVSVDRRGCGRSGRPSAGYDLDTLADDLAQVLEALDLRDVTLVAHSLGGAEALRMLARHGDARVARIALVGTTSPGVPAAHAPAPAELEAQLQGLRDDRAAFLQAGAAGFFGDPAQASPETVAWGLRLAERASLHASVELLRLLGTVDGSDDVRGCPVPALVLHGDADPSAPLELTGAATAALLPDARLEVYAGAPHGLPLTHPARVAEDVLAFVRSGVPARPLAVR